MKTYKERLHALLKDTVDYYLTHERGTDQFGECSYLSQAGDMCAAGRLMKKSELNHIIADGDNEVSIRSMLREGNSNYRGPKIFKKKYQDIHVDFFIALQSLHDDQDMWEATHSGWTLSIHGNKRFADISRLIEEGLYGTKGRTI